MSTKIQPETAAQWLSANLPTWEIQDEHLVRVYRTPNWQVTLMVANAIGFVAEAADHHPQLTLNYPSVEVQLQTHRFPLHRRTRDGAQDGLRLYPQGSHAHHPRT